MALELPHSRWRDLTAPLGCVAVPCHPVRRTADSTLDLIECERMSDEFASTEPSAAGTHLQRALQVCRWWGLLVVSDDVHALTDTGRLLRAQALVQLLRHDSEGTLLMLIVEHVRYLP